MLLLKSKGTDTCGAPKNKGENKMSTPAHEDVELLYYMISLNTQFLPHVWANEQTKSPNACRVFGQLNVSKSSLGCFIRRNYYQMQ